MRKLFLAFILFCGGIGFSFSQIINTNFIAPDTVCVNQTFTVQNTSTGSINTSYWNFCSSSVTLVQGVNLGPAAVSFPVFASIQNDAGAYYMFVTNNSPGSLSRFSFGASLNNIPTSVNLGNLANQMPGNGEGIFIEKEGTNWYGVVVGGPTGEIVRLNFGTSIANTPTAVNMGNIGAMSYPHRLQIVHSGGNKYGFTINRNNNTITRFNFGNSLSNTPSGTNLGNIGGLGGPNDIAIVNYNGNWYAFVTNDLNSTITRLDFGTSLLNTPIGTNLGNPGFNSPRGISLDLTCGGLTGQLSTVGNSFFRLNFPSGPTGPVTLTSIGNIAGFNFPHAIEKYRVNDTVYTFITNANGQNISRLKYASCINPAISSSTLTSIAPITYTATGVYTISLLNNSNQYNQSVYCKTVVAISGSVAAASSATSACSGASVTLTATGANSYTWNPGSIFGGTITVTPTTSTIYSVSAGSGICFNTATVSVLVNPSPTVTASSNSVLICTGNSITLSSSGANSYTWNPGSVTGQTISTSPTITTNYIVTGQDLGGCTATAAVAVTVVTTPTLVFSPSSPTACIGNTVSISVTGASNYTWNPGNFTTSTIVVSPTATTIYTVQGSLGTCSSSANTTLQVLPIPTINATANSSVICFGGTSTLTANGAISYTWSPSNGLSSSTASNVTASPSVSTCYTVVGFNAFGCPSNTNLVCLTVTNTTQSFTTTASPSVMCSGQSSTLSSLGASTYTYYVPLSFTPQIVVSPTTATIYTVQARFNDNCLATNTLLLNTQATPTVAALSTPSLLCAGDQITLEGSGASSYTWNPGVLTGSTVMVSPSVSITYTLYGQTGVCAGSVITSVSVNPVPSVSVSISSVTLCQGNSTTAIASGAINYSWNPSGNTNSLISLSPSITIVYTVTGTSFNCSNSNTLEVIVLNTPTLSIVSSPSSTCYNAGTSITLTANGADSYNWSPFSIASESVVITPTTSSLYIVSGSNTLGCSTFNTIEVNVNPNLTYTLSQNQICSGKSVTLSASGASNYLWLPNNETQSIFEYTPSSTVTYTIIGTDGLCTTTNTFEIKVIQNPITDIPEVFTPNDDGKNDVFKIVTQTPTKIKLSVFNRWGNLVYHHNEYDNSWNGTSSEKMQIGNEKLPEGTYYYIIELDHCNHELVKGFVVIQY